MAAVGRITMRDDTTDMRQVLERLTRLEERGTHRDERMERIESTLATMAAQISAISNDLRDAKTGLRVMLWFSTTLVPAISAVIGWFAHVLWPGK